jgi:hypothetical protein
VSTAERRRAARSAVPPDSSLARPRIVGGADALALDVSAVGIRVATRQRLAPGRTVVMQWPGIDALQRMRAVVLRSTVARLLGEEGVEYGVALQLVDAQPALAELATRPG